MDTASQPPIAASEIVDEKIERILYDDDLKATTTEQIGSIIQIHAHQYRGPETNEWTLRIGENFMNVVAPQHVIPFRITGGDNIIFWSTRHGQAWQPMLEQHVAAYRRKARPFSTDPAMMMKVIEEMKVKYKLRMSAADFSDGWYVGFGESVAGARMNAVYTVDEFLPAAVALAAAAALEGR